MVKEGGRSDIEHLELPRNIRHLQDIRHQKGHLVHHASSGQAYEQRFLGSLGKLTTGRYEYKSNLKRGPTTPPRPLLR